MKKILITGANSYIGMSFEKYIRENYPNDYTVDTVDMIDGTWREKSFSEYDSVFHVAGIAHRKETSENAALYYKVNCDLAVETAEKAKKDGVKQFVFLSSMSVYGVNEGVITKDTVPTPGSNYGKSKLQAEEKLNSLRENGFKMCVLRPPMVYGPGCKGNFQTIIAIVKKSPVFPQIENRRSLIYVDNLSSFVHLAVEKELDGLYFPSNRDYVKTTQIAAAVAKAYGKRVLFSRLLGLGTHAIKPFVPKAQKAFGTLIYKDTEDFNYSYCVDDNEASLFKSAKIAE